MPDSLMGVQSGAMLPGFIASAFALAVAAPHHADEEVIVYPTKRLDEGNGATRYALEFSGTLTTKTTFNPTSTLANPDEIDLRIEGFSNRTATTAIVRLKNWLNGQWVQVGTYDVPVTSDDDKFFRGMPEDGSLPGAPDWDFIRESDGRIEVQVEHQRALTTGITNFDSVFDFVQIVVIAE